MGKRDPDFIGIQVILTGDSADIILQYASLEYVDVLLVSLTFSTLVYMGLAGADPEYQVRGRT